MRPFVLAIACTVALNSSALALDRISRPQQQDDPYGATPTQQQSPKRIMRIRHNWNTLVEDQRRAMEEQRRAAKEAYEHAEQQQRQATDLLLGVLDAKRRINSAGVGSSN
jgi:hypothetical protein